MCRSPEHKASECPNPRTADGVECRRCNEGKPKPGSLTGQDMSRLSTFYVPGQECTEYRQLTFLSSRALRQGLSAGQCATRLSQLRVSTTKLKGAMIHPIRGPCTNAKNRSESHMARDCEKPVDVSSITCHNCHEIGHFRQDCTKKRDYSRIQCNNCGECISFSPCFPLP